MKRIFLSLVLFLPLLFIACDTIELDERIVIQKGETFKTTPITENRSEQRVLLEDYTGWACPNCPEAAEIASNLINSYNGKLIVMAVHAGTFARPQKLNNYLDLRTPYGNEWNKFFGITGYPAGIINRRKLSNKYVVQHPDWANKINEIITNTPHLIDINLGAQKSEGKILTSVEVKFLEDVYESLSINVVVLESDIIGMQVDGTDKIPNYSFEHILRTNGLVDYPLTSSKTISGKTINKNYFIDIDPAWNVDNCTIVVFVSNANTKEVIQINEVHL